MGAWYVTREEVSSAPDIKASAYAAPQLDRAIESGARRVERTLHRIFYPWTGTKRWDYPLAADAHTGVLWLDENEIISLTSLTAGGVSIPLANVLMEPVNSGPPYHSLNLNRDTTAAFFGGQQSIVAVGVWGGCAIDEISVGTLTAGINASVTTLPLTTSPGVGSILRVDSERMLVTEKLWVSSGQTGSLASSNAANSLTVSDGTVFSAGEELIIDAERLAISAVTGNTLIVQRATGGSTLAAHTTATIYWSHSLIVQRGALGTTAASHLSAAPVLKFLPPGPITELNQAYAIDSFFQAGAGYARTVGSGENERQMTGRAIRDLEKAVYGNYGRFVRFRSV